MQLSKKFTIAIRFRGRVDSLIAKQQKKAAKFDGSIDVSWGEPYRVKVPGDHWYEACTYETWVDGVITYPEMKLGDYAVVGSASRLEDKNILNGSDEISQYRQKVLTCEHCQTNRKRKWFVFVQDAKTNDLRCVGKSCLQNYVGYDPAAAISLLESWARLWERVEAAEDLWDAEDQDASYHLEVDASYLAELAVAVTRQIGFVSARMARNSADMDHLLPTTADSIKTLLWGGGDKSWFERPTEDDKAQAAEIFKSFQLIDPDSCNEFAYKLYAISEVGYVPNNLMSTYVAGVSIAYLKTQKDDAVKTKKDFFGTGSREVYEVMITANETRTSTYDGGEYQMVRGYEMKSMCEFIYMGNAQFAGEVCEGDAYRIKATVKHDTHWEHGKTNKLSRPAVIELIELETAA